jgi:hypothetical protein
MLAQTMQESNPQGKTPFPIPETHTAEIAAPTSCRRFADPACRASGSGPPAMPIQ